MRRLTLSLVQVVFLSFTAWEDVLTLIIPPISAVERKKQPWIGAYSADLDQFQRDYPAVAPVDIGSMGYLGEEGMYVCQEILKLAYADSGLALDFYRSCFVHIYSVLYFNFLFRSFVQALDLFF